MIGKNISLISATSGAFASPEEKSLWGEANGFERAATAGNVLPVLASEE
jgi:hypothetical protein